MQINGNQTATLTPGFHFGWLRGLSFDITFVIGVAALALAGGGLAVVFPRFFPVILFLDLWLLGYHHVVATFTRLAFDMASFQEHKFLVAWLPMIIVAATIAATLMIGPWILATAYLYWQWFHYTRQSYGIARIYQRKADPAVKLNARLEMGVIYILPLYGILFRSYQNPGSFLGLPLKCLPVSFEVIQVFSWLSAAILLLWFAEQFKLFRRGKLQLAYTIYMISHIVIFTVGYLVIETINEGWLVLNIWHNAQYVIFVWMYNNNRFKKGVDERHRFLSTLSQSKNIFWYYTVCLLISTALYAASAKLLKLVTVSILPWALVVYMTINFHHYVVDGIVWRIRRKPVRETLGIE